MRKNNLLIILVVILTIFIISLSSCKKKQSNQTIIGGGASFPYPLYTEMFKQYRLLHPEFKINYQSIGSGSGRKRIKEKIIEFAGSDAYMQDKDLADIEAKIVHIPTCIGAIVMAYQSFVGEDDLKLTGAIIAEIYMGKITKWNDPKIQTLNPEISLPDQTVIPVGRADGSGTTKIFSEYLTKVHETWATAVGSSKKITWNKKVVAAKGNEGVTTQIKNIPFSIGYVSLSHAVKNNLHYAAVKNQHNEFVKANLDNVSLAGNISSLPKDTRVYLVDSNAKGSYPISGFTWILFYQEQSYANRKLIQAQNLQKVLSWMVVEGQKHASPLYYAPLPLKVQKQALENINSMTYNGEKLPL